MLDKAACEPSNEEDNFLDGGGCSPKNVPTLVSLFLLLWSLG